MSGLGKGRKYAWLPESNPSALSGDMAGLQRSDSGEKTPRAARRKSGRGRGKDSKAGSMNEQHLDGLGISTSDAVEVQSSSVVVAAPMEINDASNASINVDISNNASYSASNNNSNSNSANTNNSNTNDSTNTTRRRRSRKDSVDDLVRTRFININTQGDDSPRLRADNPSHASITANVRNAITSERSAARSRSNGEPHVRVERLGPMESTYSFPSFVPLSQRSVTSTMRRGDHGVGGPSTVFDTASGENVVVIHPGSRWLRIGRASEAVPREVPHVAARRLRVREPNISPDEPTAPVSVGLSKEPHVPPPEKPSEPHSTAMDVDNSDSDSDTEAFAYAGDSSVDATLSMLRTALKQHQRHSKRKVPSNAYSQVISYNRNTHAESIHDHNDPYRVEWITDVEGDCVTGEAALRIADDGQFVARWPIRNGCFNIEEYASIEDVLGDIESIWEQALDHELGIRRTDIAQLGVVLVIPDVFNRIEVEALATMLLQRMGFAHLLVQQTSALVTFGAGFSSACVVDVGAQKTSITCVEDGHCSPESRVTTMYGGDDITRFLYHLFVRSHFPYASARLSRSHDWMLLNDLRERFCTVNLSDVNIRLHSFFVRTPNANTLKYEFKAYDEPYQAPLCLFYPEIMDAYYEVPNYGESFVRVQEVTPTRFGILPARAEPEAHEPAIVPQADGLDVQSTDPPPTVSDTVPLTYVPDPQAQFARMPLDAAITHSIVHSGSIDRARKMYASIVIVGGGVAFIPGFDSLLSSRLLQIRPDYLPSVDRIDIVAPPRDLDPRVLAWKGGAVLSRLDTAREMWVSQTEWADFGSRMLRDRVLFQW
ncbi:actin-like protein arp8 [Coemansia sp. RSA 1199]|nr:actin-like protein arp8 [Coemansia sp. RSA 1199]